jgi:uncharacterized membrane protein
MSVLRPSYAYLSLSILSKLSAYRCSIFNLLLRWLFAMCLVNGITGQVGSSPSSASAKDPERLIAACLHRVSSV